MAAGGLESATCRAHVVFETQTFLYGSWLRISSMKTTTVLVRQHVQAFKQDDSAINLAALQCAHNVWPLIPTL